MVWLSPSRNLRFLRIPKAYIWKNSVCYQCHFSHTYNLSQQMCKKKKRQEMLQRHHWEPHICKVLFDFQSNTIATIQSETPEYCGCSSRASSSVLKRDNWPRRQKVDWKRQAISEVDLRHGDWEATKKRAWEGRRNRLHTPWGRWEQQRNSSGSLWSGRGTQHS